MTGEEVRQVEELVNSWIQQDHSLTTHVVPLQEAKDKGDSATCRTVIRQLRLISQQRAKGVGYIDKLSFIFHDFCLRLT